MLAAPELSARRCQCRANQKALRVEGATKQAKNPVSLCSEINATTGFNHGPNFGSAPSFIRSHDDEDAKAVDNLWPALHSRNQSDAIRLDSVPRNNNKRQIWVVASLSFSLNQSHQFPTWRRSCRKAVDPPTTE